MYYVRTLCGDKPSSLLLNDNPDFATTDYILALKVFEQEVMTLRKYYVEFQDLSYIPSKVEFCKAVYCEISTDNEDGNLISLKMSNLFFEKDEREDR